MTPPLDGPPRAVVMQEGAKTLFPLSAYQMTGVFPGPRRRASRFSRSAGVRS